MAEAIVQVIFQDRILETARLDKDITTVGRLSDNDIVINNLGISRYHCRLVREDDEKYYIEDLESANGTLVNGVRIARAPVYSGDEIQLGKFKLVFQLTKKGVAGFFKSEEESRPDLWVGDRTIITGVPGPKPSEAQPPADPQADTPSPEEAEEPVSPTAEETPPAQKQAPATSQDAPSVEKFISELEGKDYGLKVAFEGKVLTVKGLGDEEIVVGRDSDNDIVIDNLAVSRKHAKITFTSGHYMAEDLDSANGIRINGVSVRRSPLYPGDEITVGKHLIIFDTADRLKAALSGEELALPARGSPWHTSTVPVAPPPPEELEEEELAARQPDEISPLDGKYAVKVELDGRDVGTYSLTKKVTCIGRLAENDIVIDNIGVSRLHAKILIEENGQVYVEDQDSANGIKVNGLPVQRSPLYPGDEVQILKHKLRIELAHKARPSQEAAGGKMSTEHWRMDSTFMMSEEEHKRKLKEWLRKAEEKKTERQKDRERPPTPQSVKPATERKRTAEEKKEPEATAEPPGRVSFPADEPTPPPSPPEPARPRLTTFGGSSVNISGDRFVVGKSPDADFKVEAGWPKRPLAVITREEGGWKIADRGRWAKLKVNDKPAKSATLSGGDRITVGDMTFTFENPSE